MSDGWGEVRSYHGQPVLKQPVWTWEVPCYFFTGGLAGASAGLAYLSQLRGEDELAKRTWAVAMAAISVSPALLTSDLGRPLRFINMFRMFKPTSPMSIGSWLLGASGGATTIAAANAWTGLFPRTARLARPAAALLGLPLSTYTAALIANTAVPVWHEARRTLPFVFGAGAALSAGAVGAAIAPPELAKPARRLALGAAALEVAAKQLMELQLGEIGDVYREGNEARLTRTAQAAIVAGATLLHRRGGRSRPAAAISAGLLCAGALTARFSVIRAGFRSAADPRYVVGPQRARIRRGEVGGGARTAPRVDRSDPARGSPGTVVRPGRRSE